MSDWRKRKALSNFHQMCISKPSIVVKALSGKPVREIKLTSAVLGCIARWLQRHTKNVQICSFIADSTFVLHFASYKSIFSVFVFLTFLLCTNSIYFHYLILLNKVNRL